LPHSAASSILPARQYWIIGEGLCPQGNRMNII
jgi:hypothetical protein